MDNKDFYIQFGLFVKERRNNLGLLQKDVADRVGITQAYYSTIESGSRQVTMTVALKVCYVLNLDFNDFLILLREKSMVIIEPKK